MTTPKGSVEIAKRKTPKTPWVEIVVFGVIGMNFGLIFALVIADGPYNPVQVCGVELHPPAGSGAQLQICVWGIEVYSSTGNSFSDFETEEVIANSLLPITLSFLGFAVGASIAVILVRWVQCRKGVE